MRAYSREEVIICWRWGDVISQMLLRDICAQRIINDIRTVVRYFPSIAVGHVQRTIQLTPFVGDAATATANLGKAYDRNYILRMNK
jgi:hypothetical protein